MGTCLLDSFDAKKKSCQIVKKTFKISRNLQIAIKNDSQISNKTSEDGCLYIGTENSSLFGQKLL